MNKSFEMLEQKRQENILQVCIEEFAEFGYANASTNRIIKAAKISKGTLFNYFGSKRELFLDVVQVCAERFAAASKHINVDEQEEALARGDVFELLKCRGMRKLKTALEYPLWFSVLYVAVVDLDEDIRSDSIERMSHLKRMAGEEIRSCTNVTLFKEEVDVDKGIEIIQIFLEGFFQRKQIHLKGMNTLPVEVLYRQVLAECDDYLLELRKLFYKSEFL